MSEVSAVARGAQTRRSRRAWRRPVVGLPFLLLLPSVVLILVTIAYPMVIGFGYGLTDGTLLRPGHMVGLANYEALLVSPEFYNALWFSFVFALFNLAGSYGLGMGFALLLNMDVPGRGFFRVALLLPWIVPSVVSIVSWRWMLLDEHAVFNQLFGLFGAGPFYFLSSDQWAVASVITVKIWRAFPFMMLSLLAGLQGIDRTLFEAARMDGASSWRVFRHITMPQLSGLSIVLCLLMTIWTVNDFDTPWLMTQGGPAHATENLVLLAYRYTFGRDDVGLGSATSFITLLILMVLVVVLLRTQREEQAR